jgi:hypothetical protein
MSLIGMGILQAACQAHMILLLKSQDFFIPDDLEHYKQGEDIFDNLNENS